MTTLISQTCEYKKYGLERDNCTSPSAVSYAVGRLFEPEHLPGRFRDIRCNSIEASGTCVQSVHCPLANATFLSGADCGRPNMATICFQVERTEDCGWLFFTSPLIIKHAADWISSRTGQISRTSTTVSHKMTYPTSRYAGIQSWKARSQVLRVMSG